MGDIHTSGAEISAAIEDAVAELASSAGVSAIVATGVQTPANAAYNQADQTALANAVLEIKTKFNALLTALGAGA